MAINRNFLVKQGIQVGLTANAGSTWTSNNFISNKNDVLAVPSLTLDFTKGYLDPRVQNLRASSATYVDQNGLIQIVGNNTPRIEYDIDTGRCRGLVAEEARTNLFWYSDIEGSVGSLVRGMDYATTNPAPVVSTDYWIGPNKMSAKHVRGVQGDNNVGYLYNQQTMTGNSWYTFSMYVYIPSTSTLNNLYAFVETGYTPGVINPGAFANLSIRDKWQRIVNPYVANTSIPIGNMAWVLRIDPPGAVVYSDCWQLEQGEYASTWIPTTNVTTATRIEDRNYIFPFTQYHNPTDFSIHVEATPKWTANSTFVSYTAQYGTIGSNRSVAGLNFYSGPVNQFGGSPYNGYGLAYASGAATFGLYWNSRAYGNTTQGFATSGSSQGVTVANTGYTYNTFVANTSMKFAATANSTVGSIMLNGNTSTYANGGGGPYLPSIYTDLLSIGWAIQGGVGPLEFGGNIKKLSYFPRSLTLNELTAITET